MVKKLFAWAGLFESNLSAVEWAWRLVTLAVVAAGGTTAGLLAKGSSLFGAAGPLGWMGIGLVGALLVAIIFALVKVGYRQVAEADYLRALSLRESPINPVLDSFTDRIIHVHDLHLPRRQVHTNKQFKRCKFVGPGAIAILGGSYISSGFYETGTVIVLPENAFLTGIVVLENCTVEHCEFFGVTLLTNKMAGEAFKKMGVDVGGL